MERWSPLRTTLRPAARAGLSASVVETALDILERKDLLPGKNPWVWAAALWLASFKKPGLLTRLAEAAGAESFLERPR